MKGNFWRSIEELRFALNGIAEKQLENIKNEPDVEQLAVMLSRTGKL